MKDDANARVIALQCLVSALVEVLTRDPDVREDIDAATKRHLQNVAATASRDLMAEVRTIGDALLRPRRRRAQHEEVEKGEHQAHDLWHPISTAPQDGTYFDVWTASGRRYTRVQRLAASDGVESPPVYLDTHVGTYVPIADATHWRPLPPPPQMAG